MRAREVVGRIKKLGGRKVRQVGSHARYEADYTRSDGSKGTVATAVAMHPGDVPPGHAPQDRIRHEARVRRGMAAMTTTYVADARFEDGQWQATVRDLAGAHTYGRTVETLRKRLREVIVLMDNRPDTDVADEDGFQIGLAFDVHVTDEAGATESVSVTVRPVGIHARGEIQEPRVTVGDFQMVEHDDAHGGVVDASTPTASLELHGMAGGAAKKPAAGGVLELRAAASLGGAGRVSGGSLELGAAALLSGTGTLSAGGGARSGGAAAVLSGKGTLSTRGYARSAGSTSAGPPPAHEAVAAAALLRQRAEAAEQEAEHATRIAVLVALSAGMGMRDIATILGISYQRVSQIAAEGEGVHGAVTRRRVKVRRA